MIDAVLFVIIHYVAAAQKNKVEIAQEMLDCAIAVVGTDLSAGDVHIVFGLLYQCYYVLHYSLVLLYLWYIIANGSKIIEITNNPWT